MEEVDMPAEIIVQICTRNTVIKSSQPMRHFKQTRENYYRKFHKIVFAWEDCTLSLK